MTPEPAFRYSLVIPAYNEEARITPLLDSIGEFDGELIVVCDGTDRTAEIVRQAAARRTGLEIRCLEFGHRLGKGGGVRAGLSAARAPLVGYIDADGSTSIREILRLFPMLVSADAAIGSRWVPGSSLTVRQGWMRRFQSRGFNLIMRTLFGLPFHDTQCGAKVFRKTAIDAVLPAMISQGFEFDVELLWRLRSGGYTILEIPIEWKNKGDSRVKKRDMIGMLSGLIRVRFHRGCA